MPLPTAIAYWPIRKSIRCCCPSVPVSSSAGCGRRIFHAAETTLLNRRGAFLKRLAAPPALFVRIDRLLAGLNDADIDQHRQHVRNRIDVDDLVILEGQDGEPMDVDLLPVWRHTHVGPSGLYALMVAEHADLVLATTIHLEHAI